jgi:hypothetical protein
MPKPRALQRLVTAAGVTLLAVLSTSPASAHGTSLPDSKYYSSVVTAVTPAVQGLTISLTQGGESVTLTNHSGSTVEVLGYTGEEYLRIAPSGVEENTNSLSAFLNGSLIIQGLPQQLGSQEKPPSWKHVSDQPVFSWHDHRVHWMAQQRPPVVAAAPGVRHTVFDWSMQLRVDGQPVIVHGTLTWLGKPGPSLLAWVVLALGVLIAGGLVYVVWRERTQRRAATTGPAHAAAPTDDDSADALQSQSPIW